MIKVVQLQYSTKSAGSAAFRLQEAFKNENIDSYIISLQEDKHPINKIYYLKRISRIIALIDRKWKSFKLRHIIKKFGLFSYPILGTNVTKFAEVKKADIIYIHWVLDGFLNLRNIAQLARLNKPVIIFLHDMWIFTGGCHYSFTCEKYMTGCGECQMFSTFKKNDLSAREFKRKAKLYSKYSNFYFVSPSKWLYDCAKVSLLTKDKPLFYIPNFLNDKLFKPFDKNTAKQIFNIDRSEKVIAFGAISVDSPYKGWFYLQKALEILAEDKDFLNISILIFGSGYNKEIAEAIPFKTKFLGFLSDQYSTPMVYNAADVFIVPSLAEAFGYVVLESLSCGTPVVGFDVGGIPDMIKHKENGYLAKYKDAADIVKGIKFCLTNDLKGYVVQDFKSSIVIKKHLEMFAEIRK